MGKLFDKIMAFSVCFTTFISLVILVYATTCKPMRHDLVDTVCIILCFVVAACIFWLGFGTKEDEDDEHSGHLE